jgi:dihydrofolate reductase
MGRIVGYIATSLDGYIATAAGTLDWLTRYETVDFGDYAYGNFIKTINTVVMGRSTYDFIANEAGPWPYAGQRTIVVTSRPVQNLPPGVELWASGIDELVADLRADEGRVWMAGGGRLQMAFIERGALDEIEVFVVPELIGGGLALFPATGFAMTPTLVSATTFPPGVVRLHYRFAA